MFFFVAQFLNLSFLQKGFAILQLIQQDLWPAWVSLLSFLVSFLAAWDFTREDSQKGESWKFESKRQTDTNRQKKIRKRHFHKRWKAETRRFTHTTFVARECRQRTWNKHQLLLPSATMNFCTLRDLLFVFRVTVSLTHTHTLTTRTKEDTGWNICARARAENHRTLILRTCNCRLMMARRILFHFEWFMGQSTFEPFVPSLPDHNPGYLHPLEHKLFWLFVQ